MTLVTTTLPLGNSLGVTSGLSGSIDAQANASSTGKHTTFSLIGALNTQSLLSQALAAENSLNKEWITASQELIDIQAGGLSLPVQDFSLPLSDTLPLTAAQTIVDGNDLPQLALALRKIAAGLPLDDESSPNLNGDINAAAGPAPLASSIGQTLANQPTQALNKVDIAISDAPLNGVNVNKAGIDTSLAPIGTNDLSQLELTAKQKIPLALQSTANEVATDAAIVAKTNLKQLQTSLTEASSASNSLSAIKTHDANLATPTDSANLKPFLAAAPTTNSTDTKLDIITEGKTLQQRIDELGELLQAAHREPRTDARAKAATSATAAPDTTFISRVELPTTHHDWGKQLGQKIGWMATSGVRVAQLQLNPAELGPLHVRIDTQQEQTVVTFTSHVASVRDTIDAQLPRMRELFQEQGLQLLDVDIQEHPEQQQRANQDGEQTQQQADASDDKSLLPQTAANQHTETTTPIGLIDYYI